MGGDGLGEQLPLALEGDDVGVPRRDQGGDHHADDGDGDNQTERDQSADTAASPAERRLPSRFIRLHRCHFGHAVRSAHSMGRILGGNTCYLAVVRVLRRIRARNLPRFAPWR